MPVAIRIPLTALRFCRWYRSADCHGSCDPRNDVEKFNPLRIHPNPM